MKLGEEAAAVVEAQISKCEMQQTWPERNGATGVPHSNNHKRVNTEKFIFIETPPPTETQPKLGLGGRRATLLPPKSGAE